MFGQLLYLVPRIRRPSSVIRHLFTAVNKATVNIISHLASIKSTHALLLLLLFACKQISRDHSCFLLLFFLLFLSLLICQG